MKMTKFYGFSFKSEAVWILLFSLGPAALGFLIVLILRLLF
jgi:hypothetical protein